MIDNDVILGKNVKIFSRRLVNLFGCKIGDRTFIGPFVEITRGVGVGKRCKIESHAFICDGVTIDDGVFIGHGVVFTNDLYPQANRQVVPKKTLVKTRASIGSNATIIGGVTIGEGAIVGAGAVVTNDVSDFSIVVGNPARTLKKFQNFEAMSRFICRKAPLINNRQKAKVRR